MQRFNLELTPSDGIRSLAVWLGYREELSSENSVWSTRSSVIDEHRSQGQYAVVRRVRVTPTLSAQRRGEPDRNFHYSVTGLLLINTLMCSVRYHAAIFCEHAF